MVRINRRHDRRRARAIALSAALALVNGAAAWGAATDNHVLRAVPAPGAVAIDGRLDDWDRSGRIPVCAQLPDLYGRFSAWVMMMYDADALYVGVDWCDATPAVNDYDPALDIDRRKCFHSDSLQLHFKTDVERKVIGWWHEHSHHAAVVTLDGWMPWSANPIVYTDGIAERGIAEAFTIKPDRLGYVQEMRIPWTAIVASGKAYRAGDTIACMLDLVWGPDNGKGWPISHMMDLVQPGANHGGWFWEVPPIYGTVELSPTGHLPEPSDPVAPAAAAAAPEPIRVRADLPEGAPPWFSLVIDDEQGRRVRTLPGSCRADACRVPGSARTVEVGWDGLDDLGRIVQPGRYRVAGVVRDELTATYEQCFYNPGTPPWPTADGTGAWGADHSAPTTVCAIADGVLIGWPTVEGGNGLIKVGADGRRRWGDVQSARIVTADEHYAYFMLDDFWSGKHGLARLDHRDDAYRPWTLDGRAEMPVPVERLLGGPPAAAIEALAVHGDRLVLVVDGVEVVELSAETTALVRRVPLPGVRRVAFAADGSLYALVSGQPCRLDLAVGTAAPIAADGLGDGRALAVDAAGDLVIADLGPDQQIKVFRPDGRLVRAAARRGGRPLHGPFDPQTIAAVSAIAVDAKGLIWATECTDAPRRVSVWGPDGTLARDYVGNTAYAACGSYLHDEDPLRAFVDTVEMARDPVARSWQVTRILWRPDPAKGQRLPLMSGLATPHIFTSRASGAPHEYLFAHSDWGDSGFTVFMQRPDGLRPVAAITLVGCISGSIGNRVVAEMPSGEFAGCDPFDGVFWNDRNGDAIVQRDECQVVPARQPAGKVGASGGAPFSISCGWGSRMADDLTIYADGVVAYRPIGFADDGAPRYGTTGITPVTADVGDLLPIDRDQKLIILSSTGYGGESYVRALEYGTWREAWRYPSHFHGVHGSHNASMPSPGSIIGALKIIGSAPLTQGGTVFAIRGNLGQDFLMTSDGLYVGELFADGRLPTPALPTDEAELVGKRIDDRSEGGEPFNGWFGRHRDGVVRICTGLPRQAAMVAQVHGLDSVRRFAGGDLDVGIGDVARAEQALAERRVAATPRKRLMIARLPAAPRIDGELDDWPSAPTEVKRDGATEHAAVRLGYDDAHLYVAFDVADASPWLNHGTDVRRLFKTGDAVDLQFAVDPSATAEVGAAHRRLLIAPFRDQATCVLMVPVDPQVPADQAVTYSSPVGRRDFARVAPLEGATVAVGVGPAGYRVEAALPLAALGLAPKSGLVLRGDIGFISSDAAGSVDVARTYWSNPSTNLVNDLPNEAWVYPGTWGEFVWE